MRIVFMGTPDFALPALETLAAAGHEIAAVYSQPPRPAGRGKRPRPSAVQQAAANRGLEVRTPVSLTSEEEKAAFAALEADVAVVAAYGLILDQAILDAPRHGCLNIHASLLPRWRGAAPVQRAILAGDKETGVTIMQMKRGLDTGPMLAKEATPIDNFTAGQLSDELAEIGAELICHVLSDLSAYPGELQDGSKATYAEKITKAEARLDFSQSAERVQRSIRAFSPHPGAFFEFGGERFKILDAEVASGSGMSGAVLNKHLQIACGSGSIWPTLMQRQGKKVMETKELLRGVSIPEGTRLG